MVALSGCQEERREESPEAISLGNFQEAVDLIAPEVEKRPADAASQRPLRPSAPEQQTAESGYLAPAPRLQISWERRQSGYFLSSRHLSDGGASAEAMELANELIEEIPIR